MNENISLPGDTGTGFLIVQVTTANTAIPLQGASVTVTRDEPQSAQILYVLTSGEDGRTTRMSLAAPPRTDSLSPGSSRPFATYNIEVSIDGYERAEYNHVPVFDGITAIQQANLVPLPEAGYTDGFALDSSRIFDSDNESRL